MDFTDQPGRLFAVLIFGPILAYKGYIYKDWILFILAFLLIVWDTYWLIFKAPNKSLQKKCRR